METVQLIYKQENHKEIDIYFFHSGWNTIPVECRNANKIFEFIEL